MRDHCRINSMPELESAPRVDGEQSGNRNRVRPTLAEDESAATMLEWALLLAAIGIPSYFLVRAGLLLLMAHYQLITVLNSLPFP